MRKYLTLIVGGSIAFVLLVVAALFLYTSLRRHGKVVTELQQEKSSLQSLNRRSPYPSKGNVQLEQDNKALLRDHYQAMLRGLNDSVIEVPRLTAASFNTALGEAQKRVRQQATALQVVIPPQFSLGFNRYSVEGKIPDSRNVPRLMLQLMMLEQLSSVMMTSGVNAVADVERQMFDTATADSGGGAASGVLGGGGRRGGRRSNASREGPKNLPIDAFEDDQGLYTSERFVLTFSCPERALWDVLTAFANHSLLITVRELECSSPLGGNRPAAQRTRPGGAAAPTGMIGSGVVGGLDPGGADVGPLMPGETGTPGQQVTYPPRELRVVAGREPVSVRMEVEVFQLLDTAQETEPEQEIQP